MLKNIVENRIYAVVFLTLVVLLSVAILMSVYGVTEPKIQQAREANVKALLVSLFPEMTDYGFENDIYTIRCDSAIVGYALLGNGKGYGGDIRLLVGMTADFIIKDVAVLAHTETPGLGDKVKEEAFRSQYRGLSLDDVALSKEGGKIDAISGATISSRAVTNAVRTMMTEKIEYIKLKQSEQPESGEIAPAGTKN